MGLKNLTFKGGVKKMDDRKGLTKDKAIEIAKEPKEVYIPLHQHAGSACKALVKPKDEVKVGQKIGDNPEATLTAPVHSSVSGVVKKIEEMHTHDGYKVECVVIESDGKNEMHESIKPRENVDELTKEEIVEIIREAGIVGLGGAAFPTYAKFIAPKGDINAIIGNGAECEPYLTSDNRVMLEDTENIIKGLEIFMEYFGAEGYIGIEDNKPKAIETMEAAVKGKNNIKVASLQTKFPQGDSYRMVDAILDREVPRGGRSMDTEALVTNISTTAAVAKAVYEGIPMYERVVTVTGEGVKEPKNLLVKIGTPVKDLLEQAGGFNGKPGKIIAGGPMTGYTLYTLDTPIDKGVTAIIVLTEEQSKPEKVSPCIKCGRCVDACPTHLEPHLLSANALADRFEEAEELNAEACIACGSCSYVCPAKRPIAESIMHAQREIRAKNRNS